MRYSQNLTHVSRLVLLAFGVFYPFPASHLSAFGGRPPAAASWWRWDTETLHAKRITPDARREWHDDNMAQWPNNITVIFLLSL